jgi:predicted DNA-binding protein (MmcQ/YjbR family)
MDIEQIRNYCLSKKGVEEGFPFGEDTLVFKVGGKMFMLLSLDENPPRFNVKCEPSKAVELREKYSFIIPGFHMNKAHWNTVICNESAGRQIICSCIDDSYSLVAGALPAATRRRLRL